MRQRCAGVAWLRGIERRLLAELVCAMWVMRERHVRFLCQTHWHTDLALMQMRCSTAPRHGMHACHLYVLHPLRHVANALHLRPALHAHMQREPWWWHALGTGGTLRPPPPVDCCLPALHAAHTGLGAARRSRAALACRAQQEDKGPATTTIEPEAKAAASSNGNGKVRIGRVIAGAGCHMHEARDGRLWGLDPGVPTSYASTGQAPNVVQDECMVHAPGVWAVAGRGSLAAASKAPPAPSATCISMWVGPLPPRPAPSSGTSPLYPTKPCTPGACTAHATPFLPYAFCPTPAPPPPPAPPHPTQVEAAPAPAASTSTSRRLAGISPEVLASIDAAPELPYTPLDGAERFWTSVRLAFALPWRRFKKDSVLSFKVGWGSVGLVGWLVDRSKRLRPVPGWLRLGLFCGGGEGGCKEGEGEWAGKGRSHV